MPQLYLRFKQRYVSFGTVGVTLGFDDNRSLGVRETGALAALPVFRELILKVPRKS
jgi:membrane carboxypeptidase/penicillin-binding protein